MRLIAPFLCICLFLTGCTSVPGGSSEKLSFIPTEYSALAEWQTQDHKGALNAFRRSCKLLRKKPETSPVGRFGTVADWLPVCQQAEETAPKNARSFFEAQFTPYRAQAGNMPEGRFTGYYELALKGSRQKSKRYAHPLYRVPEMEGHLPGHRAIEDGALDEQGLELIYVDDPVRRFFLQIQGSGRVILPDGKLVRVGYAGKNGCPYRALGKYLIESGDIPKEEMSAEKIRAWLYEDPIRARVMMMYNPSYVFFRELKGEGPIGAEGTALTPGVSLAVDPAHIPYGTPVWLQTEITARNGVQPWRRLMVAQDTGGAIRGPIRGDIFFGYGKEAEFRADHQNAMGRIMVLVPKAIAME